MFEAGKKYHYGSKDNGVYECLHVTEKNALMRVRADGATAGGYEFLQGLYNSNVKDYSEYKEPVIHKMYVGVYKNKKSGTVWFSSPCSDKERLSQKTYVDDLLEVKEIIYEEKV